MKTFLFVFFCPALFSCASGDTGKKPQKDQPAQQHTPSLALFTDTLKQLDKNAPAIIDSAVRLYDVLAPNDSTGADSAAASLMGFVQEVIAKQNDRLQHDTTDYSPLLDPANTNLADKQKALNSDLHK